MSRAVEHREVEFKLRVPTDDDVNVQEVVEASGLHVDRDDHRSMDATYFDTPNLTLIRWGITLRHREGGGDDGWHMKLPVLSLPSKNASFTRDELHIDSSAKQVPTDMVSTAAPLLRRQELVPVARVHTERSPFLLSVEDGVTLLEVVDDYVSVSRLDSGDPGEAVTFHEIEIELVERSERALREAQRLSAAFQRVGAVPSSVSKAAQAMGRRAGDPPDVPPLDYPDPDAPAVDALKAIFSGYVRDLLFADVGVRRRQDDAVHQMRVACRRIRSSLKTFEPILDPEAVGFLRAELAWLAAELGGVRDTEVQAQRLPILATDDETRRYIQQALEQRLRAAMSSALAALRSDRHDFLIEDLMILVAEPPVVSEAFEPARSILRSCVRQPWQKLTRAVAKTKADSPEEMWHRIRIKAKQARYAAEAVAPVLGDGYATLAKDLERATDTLGERQDAAVSIDVLRDLAETAPGRNAYSLGLIAAECGRQGRSFQHDFSRRWPKTKRRAEALGLD